MSKRVTVGLSIAIVLLTVAVMIPPYRGMVLKSSEKTLTANLSAMRGVIKQYTLDKQRALQSLEDLVTAGYFRQLPVDPITESNSTWEPVMGTVTISPGKMGQGIMDVHSGASVSSSKGTSYRSW